jgi:DNA invertase Pin-like site-specific DNA recombinase
MKKAIIYLRGHNQEKQEVFCRVYAADKGYKVLFVTTDIEAVQNCDVLLVSNLSRISRNRIECQIIMNKLKKKGIEVVSVSSQDNAEETLWLTSELMR